jgi:hypothetical protein
MGAEGKREKNKMKKQVVINGLQHEGEVGGTVFFPTCPRSTFIFPLPFLWASGWDRLGKGQGAQVQSEGVKGQT